MYRNRIILRLYLIPLCSDTLSSLVKESGCNLEDPSAASFRAHVIDGEWNEVRTCMCCYINVYDMIVGVMFSNHTLLLSFICELPLH